MSTDLVPKPRRSKPVITQRIGLGALAAALCGLAGTTGRGTAGQLSVVSTTPTPRSLNAPVDTPITVRFDRPVQRSTIVARHSFWAFGRWSGTVEGTFRFSEGDRTVTLVPDRPLSAGEQVMVILSHDIVSTDDTNLRPGGYSFQFWTNSRSARLNWAEIDRMTAASV